ncbi:lasso RiPP family leader peptide-containing protein [Streptomyces hydrogenans]
MNEQEAFNEQESSAIYEPPALVAVGEFSEDTLGFGSKPLDSFGLNFF